MTAAVVLAATQLGATAAVIVAYGILLVAVVAVFVYILRFIGPEDEDH